MKINVGCGTQIKPDWVNCDYREHPGVDAVFDACQKWPFQDDVADVVSAFHVLEHLEDWRAFFREAWRVLKPGGTLALQLPYGASIEGMSEPGHVKYWMPVGFAVFQPGYDAATANIQHAELPSFDVAFVGTVVNPHLLWLCYWPWRSLGMRLLWYIFGGHTELVVHMNALKTEDQVEAFLQRRPPIRGSWVPLSQCAWLHDWNPKEHKRRGRPADLHYFKSYVAAHGHSAITGRN